MKRKCTPSKYAVIGGNGEILYYGFRCPRCGIAGKRFRSKKRRNTELKEHVARKYWKY